MRKIFTIFLFCLLVSTLAWAENERPGVEAYIDLGAGNGAIIIVGDGNTIYLPPTNDEQVCDSFPNEITVSRDDSEFYVVMNDTHYFYDGVRTEFTKIVFVLKSDGSWDILWAEQE